MPAPKGNNYNMKFKTSKERQKLCDEWCRHRRKGYSKESFPLCDPQTFKRYKKDFPEDFDTKKIREAEAANRIFWEELGIKGALGEIDKFSASSWVFNMKNRFGWTDRQDLTSKGEQVQFVIDDSLKQDE